MDAFHKSFNKESFGGEIVEIMDLQANDWWTKPCKWAAHNEERRNTMKTNFQWRFMPRVSTTGSMLADIMDASKKKQH